MTLGFNFDMALHLPSSHSSSTSHHSLSHHDSISAAAAASIGIHHSHQQQHNQQQQQNNHGYSSYPIKYEACEHLQHQQQHHQHLTTTNSSSSPSSSSSSSAVAGTTGIGMIGAHDFLLHQQQISSISAFERDFFDTLDSTRMNGNNNHQHPHSHSHHHHRMLSSSSDNIPNGLSNDSPESDESEDDETLHGMNIGGNSDSKHRQQHLRALEKSSSLNSNNNNSLDRKRPYPCKVCPSKFGSKMELEEHQNSHTGQKPFECEVCKSRFNRRSTLWNHKRIHSDAKPFVCTICHMQFKWKNSLKCHKEMHIRKNETPSIGDIDSDIRQLTYATAAKRKMLEMDGGDSMRSASSLTIFSAAPSTSSQTNNNSNNGGGSSCSSSHSSNESSKNAGQRKRQKLSKKESNSSIKKEPMEPTANSAAAVAAAANNDAQQLNLLMNKAFGTQDFDNSSQNNNNNYQGLMSNQAMRKLTFGNLGADFDNSFSSNNLMSRDFGADFNLDHSNLDLMNNPLWMQLWNNEQVESMNQLDFNSNRNQNTASLFGGMDDPSKVLTSGIFDLKDTLGLHSPNNGNNTNNNNNTAHINMLLPKFDLNSFNSLHDSVNQHRNHSNFPGINHLASATTFPDYSSTHDNNNTSASLTQQFHLGQNGQSTTSSSSTPSSNGHQANGHLNSDLTYHQPIDHALLLNTNHSNDYMLPLEYMTPTGGGNQSIYPTHDLPLSALTSSHDPLEHSPHSSTTRGMFYHSSNLSDHHPGCISSSQIQNVTASTVAAVQQMR